ncbi:uncharacterized protein LOC106076778 [Biomphalaria glabrata]|uniref:Uncharacterized protein LOC106076778 n=1 Tax=Biomphalaria glabrata TaxID=6526 RepID=A0A9W3B8P4_BIOGL|nr:uncharacterized protein LOC106076778 [Biomphalaria glabrata]
MHRLLLLCCISTVLTISDAANVAKRDEQCTGLLQCSALLSKMETSSFGPLHDKEQYKQLCQKNGELQKCYNDNKDDCEDLTLSNMLHGGIQTIDFFCSAEGKEELDSIKDSPCVDDQTTFLSAKEEMKKCEQTFQKQFLVAMSSEEKMESFNICLHLDQLRSCILGSVENHCGQKFGIIARKLFDIEYQPFATELDCGQ